MLPPLDPELLEHGPARIYRFSTVWRTGLVCGLIGSLLGGALGVFAFVILAAITAAVYHRPVIRWLQRVKRNQQDPWSTRGE